MTPTHDRKRSKPGPTNSLVDVSGIRVGHTTRQDDGWLSGTTVVLTPQSGCVAGVDVRGGGPGTRETDLLDPRNLVENVHAIVLSGGSAFGLAAANGVMDRLAAAGVGLAVTADAVVPIVPAAVVFDLGRGGDGACRPGRDAGAGAYDDAVAGHEPRRGVLQGVVGAGTGAVAGQLKGAVGSASVVLPDGATVAALAVVNALGSCVDLQTGELYAARHIFPGELPPLSTPAPEEVAAHRERVETGLAEYGLRTGAATTIGVVATDTVLTKAQCAKVSGIAHDGLARAIRPAHTMFDGDTIFTLATGARGAPDAAAFHGVLQAAANCFSRAIAHAMLCAESVETPAGRWLGYRDAFPSAFTGDGRRYQ